MTEDRDNNTMLRPRQARFVAEYLVDLNSTQAAIRAGYAARTADVQGPRLLGNVRIRRAIERGAGQQLKKLEITAEKVLERLWWILDADPGDFFDEQGSLRPVHTLSERQRKAIGALEVIRREDKEGAIEYLHKVKWWDKMKAMELAARYLGLVRETPPAPAVGPITIQVAFVDGSGKKRDGGSDT